MPRAKRVDVLAFRTQRKNRRVQRDCVPFCAMIQIQHDPLEVHARGNPYIINKLNELLFERNLRKFAGTLNEQIMRYRR